MTEHTATIDSLIGPLIIAVDEEGSLIRINFVRGEHQAGSGEPPPGKAALQGLEAVRRELDEYFRGERKQFEMTTKPRGTPFQLSVWHELERIPYGATISYMELAKRIGKPDAVRAVGAANGANPIPVVIPCHRVIGSNGKLVGYGGGLDRKELLLSIERSQRRLQ
jgi:methylated-DNA-[protein]-cysteine S-methyltransferase